ncbi:hypothetical protein BDV98DRAFT_213388 [Pterulicium gracile]|uniref:Uncharacterized protein n=1 Tax=Pterulicium gracile TaxID=1884261 RepID=A0A5C3QAU1_9AGAR|nr:hypothetical protein BDV98DRAFT_213388 [Pterula gracilis]
MESILFSSPDLRSLTLFGATPEGFEPTRVWPCSSDATKWQCFYVADDLCSVPTWQHSCSRYLQPLSIRSDQPRRSTTPFHLPLPDPWTRNSISPQTLGWRQDAMAFARPSTIAGITFNGDRALVEIIHRSVDSSLTPGERGVRGLFSSRGPFDQVIRLFHAPEYTTDLCLSLPNASAGRLSPSALPLPGPGYSAWLSFVDRLHSVEELDISRGYEIFHALIFPQVAVNTTSDSEESTRSHCRFHVVVHSTRSASPSFLAMCFLRQFPRSSRDHSIR